METVALPESAGNERTGASPPFQCWYQADGVVWASFHHLQNGYLVRFPGLADFTISANGTTIHAYPTASASEQTIEHLLLNQVQPLALSRQHRLVLHGGAIEVNSGAIVFLGHSGRGKSTLTASFATRGHRFLTDDGLQLEPSDDGYIALPSHPSIRLWDDSREMLIPQSIAIAPPVDYTPKARLLAGDAVVHCPESRPLKAVYFLGEGESDGVCITPISGRDAIIEMVRHSFLLDIEEREMLSRHFGQLAVLAKKPIFFRLDYPRHYHCLPQVREAVIRHATASAWLTT